MTRRYYPKPITLRLRVYCYISKALNLSGKIGNSAIRGRRRGAAASKSATSRIEGSKVTCVRNFLIRIRIGGFHTVCPYKLAGTLVRWYGTRPYQVQQA